MLLAERGGYDSLDARCCLIAGRLLQIAVEHVERLFVLPEHETENLDHDDDERRNREHREVRNRRRQPLGFVALKLDERFLGERDDL